MSNSNLTVNLSAKTDREGKTYYIGRLKLDAQLNFEKGVAFLVFVSEAGSEELQICPYKEANHSPEQGSDQ